MTDPNTMPAEVVPENFQAPTPTVQAQVIPKSKTSIVRILIMIIVLMGVGLIALALQLIANNKGSLTDNTPLTSPTSAEVSIAVTPTSVINTSAVTPSISITRTVLPTNTSSPTPTTAILTKKVSMTAYNTQIYIPQSWNYTYTDVGIGDGGYYFVDGNGNQTFSLANFDGGVIDNFCRSGQGEDVSITIGGKAETISNCYVNGQFSFSYGWFNHTSSSGWYAYDSNNPLSDQYKQILGTITYTN
jgi:hypothetical protein